MEWKAEFKGKRKAGKSPSKAKKFKPSGVPATTLKSSKHEIKSVDVPASNTAISTTASFALLNGMVQGTTQWNRIGRRVQMKSIAIRGRIYYNQAGGAPGADYLRVMLIYDRQPNGAAPAIGDIIAATDQAGTTTTTCFDGLNMSNADRFKVLREYVLHIPSPAAIAGGANQALQVEGAEKLGFKWFVKLGGLETHFKTGNAGTIADISTGSLYLVTFGQQAAADAQWGLTISARLRFDDL